MFKKYIKQDGHSNVQYWIDENGQDWYDYADNTETTTLKILTNESDMVVAYSYDATTLNPNNCNLHIIQPEDAPKDLELVKYSYDGEKFYLTKFKSRNDADSIDEIKDKLFMLMLKNKLTADEKKQFEELKSIFEEKISK